MPEQIADQASGLRRMFRPRSAQVLPLVVPGRDRNRRHAVDTGRSWLIAEDIARFAARLAKALTAHGRRPLLLDGDHGLIAAALGLRARFELAQWLSGDLAIGEVMLSGGNGSSVLPAVRGLRAMLADRNPVLSMSDAPRLSGLLSALQAPAQDRLPAFDTTLLCADAQTVAPLLRGRITETILLCPNDSRSREQAYAAIKTLANTASDATIRMVYHGYASVAKAQAQHDLLAEVVGRFLEVDLRFAGITDQAEALAAAVVQWRLPQLPEYSGHDEQPDPGWSPRPSIN